ncbi:MAG: right-handed parallel beta-helix repeat-containing protein [Candidatus Asgardarchaeia archaeon]
MIKKAKVLFLLALLVLLVTPSLQAFQQVTMPSFTENSHLLKTTPVSTKSITGTSPPASGDWVITGVTIVEDEQIIVNGSIIVDGGTLVIKNSAIYINSTPTVGYNITIRNGGNLTVIDSIITAYNTEYTYFISGSKSNIYIEGSEISYALYNPWYSSYYYDSNLTVIDSIFHDNDYAIYIWRGSLYAFNVTLYNNSGGILLEDTSNVVIANSSFDNIEDNLRLINVANVTIENNTLRGNAIPLYLNDGENITIANNVILDTFYEISIQYGTNVTIANNTIEYASIIIDGYNYQLPTLRIENNTLGGKPILYYVNEQDIVMENVDLGELIVALCDSVTIKNSYVHTLYSHYTRDVVVYNTTFYDSAEGVFVRGAFSVNVTGVSILNTAEGAEFVSSDNIVFSNNYLRNTNDMAIRPLTIFSCDNILVSFNEIIGYRYGVYLYSVNNLTMHSNKMTYTTITLGNNNYATLDISENNTINGYPVKYYYNVSNIEIADEILGEIICAYCSNVTINRVITASIVLTNSNNTYITTSKMYYGSIGLSVYQCTNVTITQSTIAKQHYGIQVSPTYGYTYILNNLIYDNDGGFLLRSVENVTIMYNVVMNNKVGFTSFFSKNLLISMNDFINNTIQAQTYIPLTFNSTSYGNYWSDYTGVDTNGDGIGDTQYRIKDYDEYTGDSYDYYPLMEPAVFDTLTNHLFSIMQEPSAVTELNNVTITVRFIDIPSEVVLSYYNGSEWINIPMSHNVDFDYYYATIPAMPIGKEIEYMILAKSLSGNWAKSPILKYEVQQSDTNGPHFVGISILPEIPIDSSNVKIFANVTDINGVSQVILSYSIGGSWINVTMTYNTTSGLYYATIPVFAAGTTVSYKLYAEDGYGNWAISPEYSYVVERTDDTPPVLVELSQVPLHPDDTQVVNITVRLFDENIVDEVILSYFNGTAWTNITMTQNGEYYNATIPAFPVGTNVEYKIYAKDSYDNWMVSATFAYSVAKADNLPPVLKEITQTPEQPDNTQNVSILVVIEDESTIVEVILSYYNGTGWTNVTMTLNGTYYTAEIPALPVGTEVLYKIYAKDSYGNWMISPEYHYTVVKADVAAPIIHEIIRIPQDPTEDQQVVILANVSDDNGVSKVILMYYAGVAWNNVTMNYNSTIGYYVGVIPSFANGTEVMYKIYVEDVNDNGAVSPVLKYTVTSKVPITGVSWTYVSYVSLGVAGVAIIALVVVLLRKR